MGSAKPRVRRGVWLIGVAVMAAVVAAVVLAVTRAREGELTLNSLREGVTAVKVQGVPVFLMRHGRDVQGYLDDAQHLANEQLWWCPAEDVFLSPMHGELFDAHGRALAGPASRDLDRVSVKVTADGVVIVDPFTVQQGPTRNVRVLGMLDPEVWAAYRSWSGLSAGGASTFCQSRVVGEDYPHR